MFINFVGRAGVNMHQTKYRGARDLHDGQIFSSVRRLEAEKTPKNQNEKNSKKLKTLNGRLPPEDGSVWPETLATYVSDDPRHFIFRPPTKKKYGFVLVRKSVFCCFRKKSEELHANRRHLQILHEKLRGLTIFELRTTLDASSRV